MVCRAATMTPAATVKRTAITANCQGSQGHPGRQPSEPRSSAVVVVQHEENRCASQRLQCNPSLSCQVFCNSSDSRTTATKGETRLS